MEQQAAKHEAEVAAIEAQTQEMDQELEGWNWVPDEVEGYKPAEFKGDGGDGTLMYQPLGDSAPQAFNGMDVGPPILSMAALRRPVEDMVKMEEVNEPAVLNNVRERFHRQEIYTNIGESLARQRPRSRSCTACGSLSSSPWHGPHLCSRSCQEHESRDCDCALPVLCCGLGLLRRAVCNRWYHLRAVSDRGALQT
jgi:hypothetical protein